MATKSKSRATEKGVGGIKHFVNDKGQIDIFICTHISHLLLYHYCFYPILILYYIFQRYLPSVKVPSATMRWWLNTVEIQWPPWVEELQEFWGSQASTVLPSISSVEWQFG